MLTRLLVNNYAIIDEVSIDFAEGLNVITGETGAGKSILLGALGLALGDRADLNAHFDKEKKCIVEAYFNVRNLTLRTFFDEHDLDYDDNLILRRELLSSGRSRAFVNDTPVGLKVLSSIAKRLINVHKQFATLDIFSRSFQLKMLDILSDQLTFVEEYGNQFISWKDLVEEKDTLEKRIAEAAKENDFIRFQIDEIEEINPDPESDSALQSILEQVEHSEEINRELNETEVLLISGETNVSDILSDVVQRISHLTQWGEEYEEMADRLQSVKAELDDIAQSISDYAEQDRIDPEEAMRVRERFDQLQRLYFKHRVDDAEALSDLMIQLKNQLQSVEDDERRLEEITSTIQREEENLRKQAKKISAKRKKAADQLIDQVEDRLRDLAMEQSKFEIVLSKSNFLHADGMDDVSFLFSANPGSKVQSIEKVASGGELSRLSLALKSVVASEMTLPSMIYDEIDSGVSGDTALRMGQLLHSLAASHQIIVITHSPQVAAQGHVHYFVSKDMDQDTTQTKVQQLTGTDREIAIAVMLSQDPPGKAARKNALELLMRN